VHSEKPGRCSFFTSILNTATSTTRHTSARTASAPPNDLTSSFQGDVYNFAFWRDATAAGALDDQTHAFRLHRRLHLDDFEGLVGLLQLIHSRLRFVGTGGYTITELNNERIWLGTSAANSS